MKLLMTLAPCDAHKEQIFEIPDDPLNLSALKPAKANPSKSSCRSTRRIGAARSKVLSVDRETGMELRVLCQVLCSYLALPPIPGREISSEKKTDYNTLSFCLAADRYHDLVAIPRNFWLSAIISFVTDDVIFCADACLSDLQTCCGRKRRDSP